MRFTVTAFFSALTKNSAKLDTVSSYYLAWSNVLANLAMSCSVEQQQPPINLAPFWCQHLASVEKTCSTLISSDQVLVTASKMAPEFG